MKRQPRTNRRGGTGRGWRSAVAVAAVVLTTWYASRLTSLDELVAVLGDLTTSAVALILALTLLNLVTYWAVLAAALPGLGLLRAGSLQLPSTAISNLLPAGGALGTGFTVVRLRAWGRTMGEVAAALVVNGVLGTAAKVAAALLVVVVLAPGAETSAAAPTLVLVVLGLLVAATTMLLGSRRAAVVLAARLERLVAGVLGRFGVGARPGLVDAAVRLQDDAGSLVRARWPALIAATVVSHVSLFVLFVASVRAVGLDVDTISGAELVAAFGLARAATLVPLTPGGVGLVEVALTASMTAQGGDPDLVVAAVALYRMATYVTPSVLGLVVLAAWTLRDRRRAARPSGVSDGAARSGVPLVVDLDGTLFPVTTRTVMVARVAWRHPRALAAYRRGRREDRLGSKFLLWDLAGIDLDRVPVRRPLLAQLEVAKAAGRPLFLASGAPDPLVQAVVRRTGLFVDGWGSTAEVHLVGPAKAELLTHRFGEGGFDYVGDAWEDLAVWSRARIAVLHRPGRRLRRAAQRSCGRVEVHRRPAGHTVALVWRTAATCLAQHPFRRDPTRSEPAGSSADLDADRVDREVRSGAH